MKTLKTYSMIAFGILMTILGIYLIKVVDNSDEFLNALPYVCVGIGCGMFGHGMGNFISAKSIRKHPEIQREMEINIKDERNITIMNHAKAKAYDLMTYVYGALLLAFALMGVDIIAVLLLTFAYLFVEGYAVYYRMKYDKEM